MKVIPLGNWDADVDVCGTAAGWMVAGVPVVQGVRQPLMLRWFDPAGNLLAEKGDIYTGTQDGGTFPRLADAGPWAWLAHRAIVDGRMQAAVRRVHADRTVTTDGDAVLGPADGPLALSGDYVAWQDIHLGRVYARRLTVPLGVRLPVRFVTRPTGLSRMDGAMPLFVDEDRTSVAGMLNPVRAIGLVVGEGLNGGIEVRAGGPQGTLLPGEVCGTPRCAVREPGEFAAVCWGGARLVLFSAADLVTT